MRLKDRRPAKAYVFGNNAAALICVLFVFGSQFGCSQSQDSLHGRLAPNEDGAVSLEIDEETPDEEKTDPSPVPEPKPENGVISDKEKALIRTYLKSDISNVSFLVVDAENLQAIRSYRSQEFRILASLTKIITAIGALENVEKVNTAEVASMLKTSHNGKASSLVRQAALAIDGTKVSGKSFSGAASCPDNASLDKEMPAARSVLNWLKGQTPEGEWLRADIKDGAGCNYGNRMSAIQMVEVLHFADQRRSRYKKKSFEELLSIAGRDGTWRKRNTHSRGRIFAKTGTLSAVSNLSGYFYARHNGELKKYYFVIMVNKPKGSAQTQQARSLIEALLRHWILNLNQSDLVA